MPFPDPHQMQPAGKQTAKTGTDKHGKAGPPSGKEAPPHDVAKGEMPNSGKGVSPVAPPPRLDPPRAAAG
jgi:hypothetical protein